jgi:hypothetical protein
VAHGLAVCLFDHGFARGWWRKGDLVCDPFMGICGFGIVAAYKGLRFVGVEIEERFHSLCLENVALHRRRWEAGGDVPPVCLRGDSRQFAALVAGAAGCVTSPPYADSDAHPSLGSVNKDAWGRDGRKISARRGLSDDYGTTPGQLGGLPQGDADSVITSPPYAASVHGRNGIDLAKCDRPGAHTQAGAQGYGNTPGNVGGLPAGDAGAVITSPPYEECLAGAKNAPETKTTRPHLPVAAQVAAYLKEMRKAKGLSKKQVDEHLGTNTMYSFFEGRKSRTEIPTPATWLKLKALLGLDDRFDRGILTEVEIEATGRHTTVHRGLSGHEYGTAEGQLGRESGETYWVACAKIYSECFKVLKPSGVMAVVVKDFVRARRRVPLCDQTWRLLLSLGFTPVERIRCLLSEETREPSLFGGEEIRKRSRVSFFRRLATKRGAPEIPYEEILVVRRPPGAGGSDRV